MPSRMWFRHFAWQERSESMPRVIAVAMSGGVDSSVAAALLSDSEDTVFGLMLRLWSDPEHGPNRCCSPDDVARARGAAAQLGLPFYVLDAQEAFVRSVVEPFLDGYAQGITPNPCLSCNRIIRWGFLLRHAQALGATHLATGHYARTDQQSGHWRLLRARDVMKDQSYVLSVLGQEHLAHALFPIGGLHKAHVRQLARARGLAAVDRSDSQDLCFLGGGDYRDFISARRPGLRSPGPVLDLHGVSLGQHTGLSDYTVGQRKGIRIAATAPLYVVEKHADSNTLVVGPRSALARSAFTLGDLHWVGDPPSSSDLGLKVQVRYRSREVPARIEWLDSTRARVHLPEDPAETTPGQAAVFYRGEECLGGGIILA